MPCGQKCKEILDGQVAAMAAVQKSYECMRNSLLLAAMHDLPFPEDALAEFKVSAERMARAAQGVAVAVTLESGGPGE